jgi:hypothetical protein
MLQGCRMTAEQQFGRDTVSGRVGAGRQAVRGDEASGRRVMAGIR